MIVDTHAHLTYKGLVEDVDGVLRRGREAGVGAFITVGVDLPDSRKAVALAQRENDVWAVAGVHPHDTVAMTEATLDDLSTLAKSERVVGWGETGLDFFRDHSPRETQKKWFRAQAARAREIGLPLVVHDREAHAETLEVLKEEARRGLRGVLHCFSGGVDFAREVLALGFYISIPGTVTYPSNGLLREVVKSVPVEKLLLETDCPFLSPQPLRGKKNEPANIIHTARKVAELKGLTLEDVSRITTAASRELFGVGEAAAPEIAYPIRDSLYLNITARCTNACVFCPKHRSATVKGHDLTLTREPSVEEVLQAVQERGGPGKWAEIVFCGFGEPLTRLDEVIKISWELKKLGVRKIRVNTDGLANLYHGRDVTGELAGAVDALSVSLNAPDEEQYERICRPALRGAYPSLLDFLKKSAEKIKDVTATAVALPGVDIALCAKVAAKTGVKFRERPYNEVG
ncbi:YchF/TatD family DNA exonuclease [bacterium]|nr:MAG: YchF/TatD family DNA exonuclease [bacterium]